MESAGLDFTRSFSYSYLATDWVSPGHVSYKILPAHFLISKWVGFHGRLDFTRSFIIFQWARWAGFHQGLDFWACHFSFHYGLQMESDGLDLQGLFSLSLFFRFGLGFTWPCFNFYSSIFSFCKWMDFTVAWILPWHCFIAQWTGFYQADFHFTMDGIKDDRAAEFSTRPFSFCDGVR